MSRPQMLHFGAGNIGRSLVGSIFSKAKYDITFVDALPDIVNALHERHVYRVVIKDDLPDGAPAFIDVENVDGILTSDHDAITQAVEQADLIGISVGARFLKDVLKSLAPGLLRRNRPISIVFCENLHGVAELARETLKDVLPKEFDLSSQVGLVATSIGKMVPLMPSEVRARDPLEVWGEAYNIIIADAQGFIGTRPNVEGLELKDNFAAYVDRKLYIHNLGHAVCACLGARHGCQYIWEAMKIPQVAMAVRGAMTASAHGLLKRYPQEFTPSDLKEHVDDLLRRFQNKALGDTVFRVGRDLQRKLADGDRFIGALRLVKDADEDTSPICLGIASALLFDATDGQGESFAPDAEVVAQVAKDGPTAFLTKHASLDAREFARELAAIENFYSSMRSI